MFLSLALLERYINFEAVYKQARKRIKAAIKAQRNKTCEFLAQIGPNFVYSRKAWQKINAMRSNESTKRGIPCIYSHEDKSKKY